MGNKYPVLTSSCFSIVELDDLYFSRSLFSEYLCFSVSTLLHNQKNNYLESNWQVVTLSHDFFFFFLIRTAEHFGVSDLPASGEPHQKVGKWVVNKPAQRPPNPAMCLL